jgi:hypothetical protein
LLNTGPVGGLDASGFWYAVAPTIRGVSDVAFLLGQTVKELRYGVELRFVFDQGERVEPALYADLGPFTYTDPTGVDHEVDPGDPLSASPVLQLVGEVVKSASVKDDATP